MARLDLERALRRRKISKREFAKRLKIQYKNVFRLFHADADPQLSKLNAYARALGCKVRDLIREE